MSSAIAAIRAIGRVERVDPRWVITRHVAGRSMRLAIIWGAVFGLFVFATVKAFVLGYPTLASRLELAQSLQSFAVMLGRPYHPETVAGFTSWRLLVAITVIGSIWGLLTSTGLLRGEEEAGRWEVLLAGQTTKRRATAQALAGLGIALLVMFLVIALITLAAGRSPGARFSTGGSVLFSVAMVSGAAMFLAVGALASQLSATRSQAATLSALVLGVSYVVRMIADSKSSLGWMRWMSPIGWVEELRPLRDPQLLALVPMVALVAVCAILTVILAGRRDLNASILRDEESRVSEARWLTGPTSLALRLSRPSALAWLLGIAGWAAMFGYLARSFATILSSSPAISAALRKFGVRGMTEGYLGIAFFLFILVIAGMAASQVSAIRDEEASSRLDNLLVRPVSRAAWLVSRFLISLSLIVFAGIAAGFFTWAGAASQRIGVSLTKMIEAGLNAAVPGIFVLGAGLLVLGLRPRRASMLTYGIVVWSFLANMLGSLIKGSSWLRDSSVFSHVPLLPAAKSDWGSAAVVVSLGLIAAAIGVVAFGRRDIEYE